MIPLATVQGLSTTLGALSGAALAELQALVAAVEGMAPDKAKAILFEAFPDIFDPYAATVSDVSATFYEEIRALSGVKATFDAQTIKTVPAGRWNALVGFGTQPASFEQTANALMFQMLSGGLTKTLTEMSADTIVGNAQQESVLVGYQRVPSPGCCAFCGMLASRGVSGGGSLKVMGRGVPVEQTKGKRGGQGKGLRARGSRAIGQDFHDFCKCSSVPVFESNYVQMQEDADKYYDAYRTSADKVNDGLVLESTTTTLKDGTQKNQYVWVDSASGVPKSSKQQTKMILAAMRQDLGVK